MEALAFRNYVRQGLAKATQLSEVKDFRDRAEALRGWAEAAKLGHETQNLYAEAKLWAERRAGELLAEVERETGGRPTKNACHAGSSFQQALADNKIPERTGYHWQTIARMPETAFEAHIATVKAEGKELTSAGIYKRVKDEEKYEARQAQMLAQAKAAPVPACIVRDEALAFLQGVSPESQDLLITDPPYSTDVPDIAVFAQSWIPLALSRIKPTGHAYICTGAYPVEVQAYLNTLLQMPAWTLANLLVWTYRNTLGPQPTHDYKLNWQAVFYLRGPAAPELDCPEMTEQFSVQDINAPDGRQGDRYHAWQKPMELAERFIRHSTSPGQSMVDPFAGTGTFLLAAAQLGRRAIGCEHDTEMLRIAVERGCVYQP